MTIYYTSGRSANSLEYLLAHRRVDRHVEVMAPACPPTTRLITDQNKFRIRYSKYFSNKVISLDMINRFAYTNENYFGRQFGINSSPLETGVK